MRNFLFFYAFIFKIVSSTGKLADKEKLIRFDEVASVIKLWGSVGSGRCWFVYQIFPPTIDTLTGMSILTTSGVTLHSQIPDTPHQI